MVPVTLFGSLEMVKVLISIQAYGQPVEKLRIVPRKQLVEKTNDQLIFGLFGDGKSDLEEILNEGYCYNSQYVTAININSLLL